MANERIVLMNIEYIEMEEPFDTKYPTWIIAFCPDTDSFFVTNERHFFWESEEEFDSEETGIYYFEHHVKHYINIEKEIMGQMMFGDKFSDINMVWLENTQKWYI